MAFAKSILALVLLGSTHLLVGQSHVTDSLEKKLKQADRVTRVDILNQLTYKLITIDNQKALDYNAQALRLSRESGYLKGEAVAYTYRGVYEYLSGILPEAHRDLHRGLALSEEAGDENNKGYTLLQLGNLGLEEVETDSALHYLQAAYEIFRDSTNPTTLSKIYRNLSAVYGQRFQYFQQQLYLDRAIAIRRLLPDKQLLAEALILKAGNLMSQGNRSEAVNILNEASSIVTDTPQMAEQKNDLRHVRALLLFQSGDFQSAMALVDSARDYYFHASLLRKYVTLLIDIGKVFSDRGEYELALNNLYEALQISKENGFDSETYVLRNEIGWINFHLGAYQQALQLADEAKGSMSNRKLKVDLANALNLKGVTLTEMGEFDNARQSLDSVLMIYAQLGDVRGQSEALMNLGFLSYKQKLFIPALKYYQHSLELAKASDYVFGSAWSNWGMGQVYFDLGDYAHANQYLNAAEHVAQQIKANEVLIRTYNTRRDLLAGQERYRESLYYSILANELSDSIHRSDLTRRFLNLEKMQEIEQRDRDIATLQSEKRLAEEKISWQDERLRLQYILLVTGLVGLASLGALTFVYYRFYKRIKSLNVTIVEKNKRIQTQADRLVEVNNELTRLYQEVSEQNEEIQMQANKLAESNRSINDLNRDLERIVKEKTIALQTTNEELVRYNNELLQFSYTVSHNLRGPVVRLFGLAGLAKAEEELEKAKVWIDMMHRTAGDIDLIIKDLSKILDLRNEPNQYRELVDLDIEWKQSLSLLQDSLNGHEEITANFEGLPQIITVRAMLQSIFYNLLSNAIKFRSPERVLRITATSHRTDGSALIEITDNGLGFDTSLHKEKIFKLYRRFHTHVEGRGLGLYLIKSQLEVLQGSVEVESTLNVGSIFRIKIPLRYDSKLSGEEKRPFIPSMR